jgi:hypothetical protein
LPRFSAAMNMRAFPEPCSLQWRVA